MGRYAYGGGPALEQYELDQATRRALTKAGVPEAIQQALADAVLEAINHRAAFDNEPQESDKASKAADLIKALEALQRQIDRADGHLIGAMEHHAEMRFGSSESVVTNMSTFRRLCQMWTVAADDAKAGINPQQGRENNAVLEARQILTSRTLTALDQVGVRVTKTESGTAAKMLRILDDAAGLAHEATGSIDGLPSMERRIRNWKKNKRGKVEHRTPYG